VSKIELRYTAVFEPSSEGGYVVTFPAIPDLATQGETLDEARAMAARSIVLVKDVNGTVHNLKRSRPPLSLITYGDDNNRAVGNAMAAELRSRGFAVSSFKLWPASGPASYDSASAVLTRSPVALFAVSDKPTESRGALGLPDSLVAMIAATAKQRPTILASLGNPYLINSLPEVGSYLIGWRANTVTEKAVAGALAGITSITGRLPISIPPEYPRGWGLQREVP
jgi:predicted RNase H-like HicB family nuclease